MRDRLQVLGAHVNLPAIDLVQALLTIVRAQNSSPVERVNEDLAGRHVIVLQQEMAGHAHAGNREADPPRNLQVNHRERNRDAELAVQHVIEKRVARIVEVFAVTTQALLLEEHLVEQRDGLARRRVLAQASSNLLGYLVETRQVMVRIEFGILHARNRQRRRRERDGFVFAGGLNQRSKVPESVTGGGTGRHNVLHWMTPSGGALPERRK